MRIAVLEAQDRRADLERFLLTTVDRTSSLELLADIRSQADRLGVEAVRTRSLLRQIEIVGDPIEKLQLRYALVRLLRIARRAGSGASDARKRLTRKTRGPSASSGRPPTTTGATACSAKPSPS